MGITQKKHFMRKRKTVTEKEKQGSSSNPGGKRRGHFIDAIERDRRPGASWCSSSVRKKGRLATVLEEENKNGGCK